MLARTVTSSLTRAVVDQAVAAGLDGQALLDAAGLHDSSLGAPSGRIPYERHLALWQAIERESEGRSLGLEMAQGELGIGNFDITGYIFRSCETVGDALAQLENYGRLISENARQSVHIEEALLTIEDGPIEGPRWPRVYAEHALACYVLLLSRLTGRVLVPLRTCFQHRAPASIASYTEIFGAHIQFEAPTLIIQYPGELLDTPMRRGEAELRRHLEDRARSMLSSLPSAGDADQMRAYLRDELAGAPTLEQAARRLGTGGRTLQRRLAKEQTSFGELLDEVRRAAATRLVHDLTLSMDECARRCGFAHASAFRRAFRRWTGQTPAAFRSAQSGAIDDRQDDV